MTFILAIYSTYLSSIQLFENAINYSKFPVIIQVYITNKIPSIKQQMSLLDKFYILMIL